MLESQREPVPAVEIQFCETTLGAGTVIVDQEMVTVTGSHPAAQDRTIRVPLSTIHEVTVADAGLLRVRIDGDKQLTISGQGVDALRSQILDYCRAIPEMTRALRTLGSRRGRHDDRKSAADEQQRFFSPLLDARRDASAAPTATAALAAFDALQIVRSIDSALHSLARAHAGENAPAFRALEAELVDAAEPLRDALHELDARARQLHGSVDDLALWRGWTSQLQTIFEIADRVWVSLDASLGAARPVVKPAPRLRRWSLGVLVIASCLGLAGGSARLEAQHRTLHVRNIPAESLLARGFDVVEPRSDGSLIVVNPDDERRLAMLGWSGNASPVGSTGGVSRNMQTASPSIYRSFDDPERGVRVFLDSLARVNPLVHVDSFGSSYEGRPMLAVKIGPAGESPARPNVIIMATYHAREWAATETALRLIRYLSMPGDARVDSLVRNRDIWIIPVANPDGYQFTFDVDRLWRKNRRPVGLGSDGPAVGVDLNRNHSERWGYDDDGSSPFPETEIYRGPSPSSEPEIQAIERFHRQHPPVTSISYHSYAALLLHPPGYRYGGLPGDESIFRALGGTDGRSAILDHLPGASRPTYRPTVAWNLYATNGEYTDWAYAQLGTIAFTAELTSGSESGRYYGFEFPDDEERLETLFRDNLPFALDVVEAARDPLRARALATGLAVEPIALESVSPRIIVRTPGSQAPTLRAAVPVSVTADSTSHGTFTRRWSSAPGPRPNRVSVETSSMRAAFTVLAAGGAEVSDTGWVATNGMSVQQGGVAGLYEWRGTQGAVRSPSVKVPVDVDTVSVLFWTRYDGDGFSSTPHGEIRLSTDGGATWSRAGSVSGAAPVYYPERVTVTAVRGKTVRFEFSSPDRMLWRLDEIAIVAHSGAQQLASDTTSLRPSANPVREDVVFFNWPFGASTGELQIYDLAGRLAWRTQVQGNTESIPWDVRASGVVNGVYIAVARADGRNKTFKLFITRRGT